MTEDVASKGQDVQEVTQDEQVAESPEVTALKQTLEQEKSQNLKLQHALTRQGHELGDQRKLIDRILLAQVEKPKAEKVDFFADPDSAVKEAIASHPAIQGLAHSAEEMKRQTMATALRAKHPDYMDVSKDEAFMKWVGDDKVRSSLYVKANDDYDFDCADHLLNTWKERQVIAKTAKAEQQVKQQNDEALKDAKVTTGNGGVTGRKVFSRTDLMRLRTSDPEKYNSLNVSQLYAEGRVK